MSTETDNKRVTTWSLDLNVSGVRPAAGGPVTEVPEGFYVTVVKDAYMLPDKPGRLAIQMEIKEGPAATAIRTAWQGAPNADGSNRIFWRAMMESMGYTPNQLDMGTVKLNREAFVGRTAYIYYKPGDKGAGVYEDIKFCTPADFKQRSEAFEKARAAGLLNGTPASTSVKQGSSTGSTLGASLSGALTGGTSALPGDLPGIDANSLLGSLNMGTNN